MDEKLYQKIEEMETKINEMYKVMHTAKNMMKWSLIITLVLFVIPLIILAFVLPSMLETITGAYSGLL